MMRSKVLSFFSSIRFRFIVAYMVIMTVLLAFFNVSITNMVERTLITRRVNELRVQTETVSANIASDFADYNAEEIYDYVSAFGAEQNARVLVADSRGVVQVDAFATINGTKLWQDEVADVLGGGDFSYGFHRETIHRNTKTGSQQRWLVYCVSPVIYNGERIGAVVYSSSVQDVVDILSNMSRSMQINAVGVGLMVIISSFFVATFMLNPIESLTRQIEAMSNERVVHPVAIEAGDHSELTTLAAAFNNMTVKLETTEKARNEFVSNASHELKTPLTSMKVLTESLLHSEHFDEGLTREFLSDINFEIDRLTALVTDLLLLTQMDKQSTAFVFEDVNLGDVMERALKNLVMLAKSKEITIDAAINNECIVRGDNMRLYQMVTNLTDNAIKYTPEGGHIRVSLDAFEDAAYLRVQDNGIGIPKEDIDHIFDLFYRVDRARARDAGGTGLGLSIVYQIVELHGGTIEVQSEEGRGTLFTVRLPLALDYDEQQDEQNGEEQ